MFPIRFIGLVNKYKYYVSNDDDRGLSSSFINDHIYSSQKYPR
jgi:hypothetical protein